MVVMQREVSDMEDSSAYDVLSWTVEQYGESAAFSCSFGAEDMVILDTLDSVCAQKGRSVSVFSLDTGRLHSETYALMQRVHEKYSIPVNVYFPGAQEVEEMVTAHGMNLFYASVEKRKLCCELRKVRPLKRALEGKSAWITGLRRAQSKTRSDIPKVFHDAATARLKISPLADWDDDDVWNYIRSHDVPYNKLHDAGYPSIGCEPCTRAVGKGDDPRSGRWWWENGNRECGLHFTEAGKGGRR